MWRSFSQLTFIITTTPLRHFFSFWERGQPGTDCLTGRYSTCAAIILIPGVTALVLSDIIQRVSNIREDAVTCAIQMTASQVLTRVHETKKNKKNFTESESRKKPGCCFSRTLFTGCYEKLRFFVFPTVEEAIKVRENL